MAESDDILLDLLAGMNPDRDGLLNELIDRLDESMLQGIATLDHTMYVEKYTDGLRAIVESRSIDDALISSTHEVLFLGQWTGSADERSQVMRAFCACCLLHVPDYGCGDENQSVAHLIDCGLSLGGDVPRLTREFLIRRLCQCTPQRDERVFFVLGLLLLQVRLASHDCTWFERAIHWIDLEDSCMRHEPWPPLDERWVWGLTDFGQSHNLWLRMIRDLLLIEGPCSAVLKPFGERLVAAYAAKRRTRRPKPK